MGDSTWLTQHQAPPEPLTLGHTQPRAEDHPRTFLQRVWSSVAQGTEGRRPFMPPNATIISKQTHSEYDLGSFGDGTVCVCVCVCVRARTCRVFQQFKDSQPGKESPGFMTLESDSTLLVPTSPVLISQIGIVARATSWFGKNWLS